MAVLLKVPAGSTITFQEVSLGPRFWARILLATRAPLGAHVGNHPDQAFIQCTHPHLAFCGSPSCSHACCCC